MTSNGRTPSSLEQGDLTKSPPLSILRWLPNRVLRVPLALRRFLARLLAYLSASERPPRPLPWRMLLRTALPLWFFTRVLALMLTAASQTLLVAAVAQKPRHAATIDLNSMVTSWSLWDGHFYGSILRHGYTASRPVNAGFWPLFPLLVKPFELLLGPDHWQIALLLTSNLALFAALVVLGALAIEDDETLGAARRAMILLLAAPLALFLTAAYSDSLFLALVCAALLCARRGQWRLMMLWAFLAALARPVGIVLVAPLAAEYVRQVPLPERIEKMRMQMRVVGERIPLLAGIVGAVPLGVLTFSVVCARVYGDPLAWLHAQEHAMGHVPMAPWTAIRYAWQQFWHLTPGNFQQMRVLVDAIPLAFVFLFTVVTLRRIALSDTLLLIGLLLVCTTAPVMGTQFPEAFVSAGRYLLPAVPVYLVVARQIRRFPWLESVLVGGGFALQALLTAFVLTGGWLV